jgi:DNA (cytosine-5)-methyltransferase 1
MEQTLFEILGHHVPDFHVHHHGQADCIMSDTRLSFKKITGKSTLALNWSKNENTTSTTAVRFDCPILLLNLKEGKWWRNRKDMDRFLPSGFFLIEKNYCNTHVCLKSNNKTNSLISAEDLYRMITSSMEEGLVLELPPPSMSRYTYSFNGGFMEVKSVAPLMPSMILPFDPKRPRFIDLFCGVGGFHYALSSLGARCVFAADIDENCRYNYHRNFGIEPRGDIRDVHEKEIPPFDILCAGFPCQPFSKAGDQIGFVDKTKGNLFFEILRLLRHHRPFCFILENVKNIVTHDKGNTWKVIQAHLRELGYSTHDIPLILSPLIFGSPQLRERAFIIGRWSPQPLPSWSPPPSPMATHIDTVLCRDRNETEPYRLTGRHDVTSRIWEEFCSLLTRHGIAIPRYPMWTDDWDAPLDTRPDHYQKYKNWIDKNRAFYNEHRALLQPWLETARRNPHWTGCLRKLEWQCNETSLKNCLWTFRGSGVRVRNLAYSPTLVAMSMIPVYGPEWRWLTPREICRLQDFPDSYIYHEQDCYKQMGNAVNVKVVRNVAQWLIGMGMEDVTV